MNLTNMPSTPSGWRDQADQHSRLAKTFGSAALGTAGAETSRLMRLHDAHYEIAMQCRTIAAALDEARPRL